MFSRRKKHAHVEDWNSQVGDVVEGTKEYCKSSKSGRSNAASSTFSTGSSSYAPSDSGYSSHTLASATSASIAPSRPYTAQASARRQVYQANSAYAPPPPPQPQAAQIRSSKPINRPSTTAPQRPFVMPPPSSVGTAETDCDCKDCKPKESSSPSTPGSASGLNAPWNTNYAPFNTPHTTPPKEVRGRVSRHSSRHSNDSGVSLPQTPQYSHRSTPSGYTTAPPPPPLNILGPHAYSHPQPYGQISYPQYATQPPMQPQMQPQMQPPMTPQTPGDYFSFPPPAPMPPSTVASGSSSNYSAMPPPLPMAVPAPAPTPPPTKSRHSSRSRKSDGPPLSYPQVPVAPPARSTSVPPVQTSAPALTEKQLRRLSATPGPVLGPESPSVKRRGSQSSRGSSKQGQSFARMQTIAPSPPPPVAAVAPAPSSHTSMLPINKVGTVATRPVLGMATTRDRRSVISTSTGSDMSGSDVISLSLPDSNASNGESFTIGYAPGTPVKFSVSSGNTQRTIRMQPTQQAVELQIKYRYVDPPTPPTKYTDPSKYQYQYASGQEIENIRNKWGSGRRISMN